MNMRNVTPVYLRWLIKDAGTVELCHIGAGIDPHWFTDAEALLTQARQQALSGNLFTTIHRIDRAALRAHLGGNPRGKRTPDAAIQRFTRLFFDFDPVRPKGTAATETEQQVAKDRADALQRKLTALGWPMPLTAMSGNGWHLQYRTALPNTAETGEMLKALYAGLHSEYNDDVVEFDRSVRSPGQLCTLYGSIKRKGIDHPARPHRQSLCWIPTDWRQVLPAQVAALANAYARRPANDTADAPSAAQEARSAVPASGKGNYATLDVVGWFAAHDAYIGPRGGNVHAVRCPWSSEHTTASPKKAGDTIVYEADSSGWPGFHCHHSHCSERDIRDVLRLWTDADAFCAETFQPKRRSAS